VKKGVLLKMPIIMQISETKAICDCSDLCENPECEYFAKSKEDIRTYIKAYGEWRNRILESNEYPRLIRRRCELLENNLMRRSRRRRT